MAHPRSAVIAKPKNQLEVTYVPIAELKEPSRSVRKLKKGHVERMEASLREFGFAVPLLISIEGEIIAGQQRYLAAQRLGFDELPAIVARHLTPAQIKAFRIADNRLAEGHDWDQAALRAEFEDILKIDINYDLRLTGFETAQIDLTLEFGGDDADPDDAGEATPSTAFVVSRPGDLWNLGSHKLLCGDARDPLAFEHLLAGEVARIAIVDMPFNCAIDGHVSGTGNTKHREFMMASGEMTDVQFENFLSESLRRLSENVVDGGLIYAFMDFRNLELLFRAARLIDLALLNLIVWAKRNAGMGSFYRSQHELVALFKKGRAPHVNTINLGATGRYRTNVWDYQGMNSFGSGRMEDLSDHPTVKPAAMIADAIRDATNRGDLVLDSFAGSGTMLVAAERTGRKARCVELDPAYVDVAIRRFEKRFGKKAILGGSSMTFDQVESERLKEYFSPDVDLRETFAPAARSVQSLGTREHPTPQNPPRPRTRARP